MTKSDTAQETDLAVIGSGPGGYAAAFLAADLGMKVAMIDSAERPGGVCLHSGCIPSKALLHVARVLAESREAAAYGVKFDQPKIDLDTLRKWKDTVVGNLARGITELSKRRGVQRIRARAKFLDSHTLHLDSANPAPLRFQHAILATGSSPARIPALDLKSARVMDSTAALRLEEIPPRLLVIGGGYIGLEMGTVYAALGSEITVIEMTDSLLPGADRDLVRPLHQRLAKQFSAIHLQTKVTKMVERKSAIQVTLEGDAPEPELAFDRVLVAVGRRPNTADLELENAGVQLDSKGFVTVDNQRRTTAQHIYAIGDIAGEPMLAHKASREAKVAVESIAGHAAAFDCRAIPAVVFTDPEIAWCGLTETEAKRQNQEVRIASFPWVASGRAATLARTEGLTKLILDPTTERVRGVGIVGVGAGELIAEGVLAVEMGAVARDLALTIHPHPTLTETMAEAAEVHFGHSTHLFRPKR